MTEPEQRKMRMNDNTLTKEEQRELLLSVLPACQPQEGSPANTFTRSELDNLKEAFPRMEIAPSRKWKKEANKLDILKQWEAPPQDGASEAPPQDGASEAPPQDGYTEAPPQEATTEAPPQDCTSETPPQDANTEASPQDGTSEAEHDIADPQLNDSEDDWHGAPRFHREASLAREFREKVRTGAFTGPTNGVCPGFLQCNLVVLPQGPVAFDFLLFCQRNPKACPLIDVCDVGSPYAPGVAKGADLRTDVPKYAIYRDGKLEQEVSDATAYWPEQSVAFLIGCSFSYDGALMNADIPLKSAQQGKNVPMYATSLKCRPAGCLKGNMVVSMKPIPALQVSKHIEITSKYTHAHGGPVAVGSASAIGVKDIDTPEWGDAIDIAPDEVPIFHACGVTPQSILMESKVPFAITHSAGHMFVTDLPSDMGV